MKFKKAFAEDIKKRPIYTIPELVEAMKIFKTYEKFTYPMERRKCIIIEDSYMKYLDVFSKKSYIINPRNPLKKDETVIDYDMSSEEEWNEQNGEDLDVK